MNEAKSGVVGRVCWEEGTFVSVCSACRVSWCGMRERWMPGSMRRRDFEKGCAVGGSACVVWFMMPDGGATAIVDDGTSLS